MWGEDQGGRGGLLVNAGVIDPAERGVMFPYDAIRVGFTQGMGV